MKFLLVGINAKYIHSNLGIHSLKAYAKHKRKALKAPVETEVAEYTINNQQEQVLEDIYQKKPDVIGFSCYIWNMEYVRELLGDLHKVLPDTDVWLGGPEVSFDSCFLLETEKEVLGVMKGEGEAVFADLLDCYGVLGCSSRKISDENLLRPVGDLEDFAKKETFWFKLSQIAGITYRDETGVIREQGFRPVMNLSEIPFPYEDLEQFSHQIIYYESSRGCPFSCSYCLSSVDKALRFRDLDLVRQELSFFLEQRVHQVKFVDRTFNCKKDHAMNIWRFIWQNDNGITNFHFEVAADLLDEDELELLGKMRPGLIQLEIGVQSTNPYTIHEINRKMDLEKVRQVVEQINAAHNIHQHLDLIAGLPKEDYDSFHHSFNQVYAMKPAQLQLGFLKVLKGSPIYQKAARYELLYQKKPPYQVLSTRWLSYEEITRLRGVEDMVEIYFNSGQFTCTLPLLESEFMDAFVLYEELAKYYEDKGLKGCSHSRMARYEILHQFIKAKCGLKTDLAIFEDALMCDLYLRENCKSRPSFALDQSPFKGELRRIVAAKCKERQQIHVEVLHSGARVLFDYQNRDPLTKNAAMIIVGTVGS